MKTQNTAETLVAAQLRQGFTDLEFESWIPFFFSALIAVTCKMGHSPMCVVDHELKVHGLDGLRIADASIMPNVTSGNTNAPSVMIGEKLSELITSK